MGSRIWSFPNFEELVKRSQSVGEVVRALKLSECGSAYRMVRQRIDEEGLNTSHFVQTCGKNFQGTINWDAVLAGEVKLKRRVGLKDILRKKGLLQPEKCAICGLGNEWQGKPLVLQIDHINGDPLDNQLSNLRWVCPNCHSQTSTFSGKAADIARDYGVSEAAIRKRCKKLGI